jgi:hypothetical protein
MLQTAIGHHQAGRLAEDGGRIQSEQSGEQETDLDFHGVQVRFTAKRAIRLMTCITTVPRSLTN